MSPSTIPTTTKAWTLTNTPTSSINLSGPNPTFAFHPSHPLTPIHPTSILTRTLVLSNDPAQRVWMRPKSDQRRFYIKPTFEGELVRSVGIAVVEQVGAESTRGCKVGDLLCGYFAWAEYVEVLSDDITWPLNGGKKPDFELPVYLGTLGISGLTALGGLCRVLKFKPGQTLVVSGAAGSVGNIVVQYAKNVLGAGRVVAIAGSEEKCTWLKSIGADVTLNYKSPTFEQDLIDATPDYVDAYFDNIAGKMLDSMIPRMKEGGKIAACGASANYSHNDGQHIVNYTDIITLSISIIGFITTDLLDMFDEVSQNLSKAILEGKVTLEGVQTVVDLRGKFEDIPAVWNKLYEGKSVGKLSSVIADL